MLARTLKAIVPVTLATALAACAAPGSGPDGEDEVGLAAGKADGSAFTDCELDEVLALVNDPATDEVALRALGVHGRAARNIVAYRDQLDEDHRFGTPQELDDVSWVGPVAFQQLVAAVAGRCAEGSGPEAQVIFSPQPYAASHLARVASEIDQADISLDIAMYSYSDSNISAAIERAIARGVRVRMVYESANAEHSDPEGTTSARLEALGVDVRYVNKIMHHKFILIDGPQSSADQAPDAMLITGSANWSNSAGTRYDENTVFIQGSSELVLRFQREFNTLWENSRDLVWNRDLQYFETLPITDEMIVDDPALDAVFTSANFRTYEHATYGPTFSVIAGENEIADRLIELIWSAERSIRIASGHLRSRPVAEALIARHEADPDLDIRVYLDNQEYIAASTHDEQVRDLETCLAAAGDDEGDRADCLDRGFLFAYQVNLAGIPVRFKAYCYRWHYSYAEQMHHKYMIVDDRIVASGSYNLSDNAEHATMENMVIYSADELPDLVAAFAANFEAIWETGRAEGRLASLVDEIENGTGSTFPIVFPSMALTWQEMTDLKELIRVSCPDINSAAFRTHPESHRVCAR